MRVVFAWCWPCRCTLRLLHSVVLPSVRAEASVVYVVGGDGVECEADSVLGPVVSSGDVYVGVRGSVLRAEYAGV